MSVEQRRRPRALRARPNCSERILAAACRAIQQRGFANRRIADIAAEADMSTGAIGIERRTLERDGQAVIAVLDGEGG